MFSGTRYVNAQDRCFFFPTMALTLSAGREDFCSMLSCSRRLPWQTRGSLGPCWGSELCLLVSELGGSCVQRSHPGTSAGSAAPSRGTGTSSLLPRRGCGALRESWSPRELRSYQRGLSSTEGDSVSYSSESGSMKEAGNDYGAYRGAQVVERLQKPC